MEIIDELSDAHRGVASSPTPTSPLRSIELGSLDGVCGSTKLGALND